MLKGSIVVTGSAGLIGRSVIAALGAEPRARPVRFDLRETDPAARADLCDPAALQRILADASGVIHLGGVSRVVCAERAPRMCWQTNVDATRALLDTALKSPRKPWVVYASSREVYGRQVRFPVSETALLDPVNIYARSKHAAEQLMGEARAAGLQTATVRFSSVYGDACDHADRVVPAFASAAAIGGVMRLDGRECFFDFTHVDDVARGVLALCSLLAAGERSVPTMHFVSGIGTTLQDLADIALAASPASSVTLRDAPPRTFDVAQFRGDPGLAADVLGWRTQIPLREGVARLVADYVARAQAEAATNPLPTRLRR